MVTIRLGPALVAEIIRLVLGRHQVIRAAQGSKKFLQFPQGCPQPVLGDDAAKSAQMFQQEVWAGTRL